MSVIKDGEPLSVKLVLYPLCPALPQQYSVCFNNLEHYCVNNISGRGVTDTIATYYLRVTGNLHNKYDLISFSATGAKS